MVTPSPALFWRSCTRVETALNEKQLPVLTSDAEAEAFVANSDLTEYDLSGLVPMRFEMKPKDKAVNLTLFEAVRERANTSGIRYQRVVRMAIEKTLRVPK